MDRGWIAAVIGCAALVTGCSSPVSTPASGRSAAVAAPPSTEPYLVMTGAQSGWAVVPSGRAWVLLATDDGFRHVQNATPPGVPTDGGLVVTGTGNDLAVAVEPVERLVRSPLVTRSGTGPWTTGQLPGRVVGSSTAAALRPGGPSVLTTDRGGTLLASSGTGWRSLVDASVLPGGSGLTLDGVTWAGDGLGWLTGHRATGGAVAFQTGDGGRTWTAVPTEGSAVAALAPCGEGTDWGLPELDTAGRLRVLRTQDAGATWSAGDPLPASSGPPVWGCHGAEIWAAAGTGTRARIHASSDGGATWTAHGPVPDGLTGLAPTGPTDGFAVTAGRSPTLWRVGAAGSTLTRIALPAWVADLGAGSTAD